MRLCDLSLAILVAVLPLLFAILAKDLPKWLPNTPQDCFQDHRNEPQRPPKPLKVMEGCSFLRFDNFPNNHSKIVQKCFQNHFKSSKLRPTWPSWSHHGAPRAPTWSILRPSCAHYCLNFAKTLLDITPETPETTPIPLKNSKMVFKIIKN